MDIRKKITVSTILGATFTWYDFIIFNIAVAIIFPKLFFPEMGAMLPILVFAVGLLARPLGSIVFGFIGDRFGRKLSLIGTLMLTGISTVLIGVLPTFEQIGIVATCLLILLRIMQTAAVGGEWAAASVLLTEHNIKQPNKSFITSFMNSGFAMGSILASLVFFLVMTQGDDFFVEFGWRIPFLLSAVLLIIGVYMRKNVTETPIFADMAQKSKVEKNPLKTVINKYPGTILLSALAVCLAPAWSYGVMVFGSSYMIQSGLISRPDLSQVQLLAWCALGAMYAAAGWLGDRFDRYRLFTMAAVFSLVLCWPMFLLLQQGHALYAMLLLGLLTFNLSLAPLMFSELFPPEIRQTGAGISYNLGVVFSGAMVVISQQIMISTQDITNVAYAFLTLTVLSLMAIIHLKKKVHAGTV